MQSLPFWTVPDDYVTRFAKKADARQHFIRNIPKSDSPPSIEELHEDFVAQVEGLIASHISMAVSEGVADSLTGTGVSTDLSTLSAGVWKASIPESISATSTEVWMTPARRDPTRIPGSLFLSLLMATMSTSEAPFLERMRNIFFSIALQTSTLREAVRVGALLVREVYIMRYVPDERDLTGVEAHHDSTGKHAKDRVAVMLFCIGGNDLIGGDTVFPEASLSAVHKRGLCTAFWNYRQDGTLNPSATHSTTPVLAGVKLVAVVFFKCAPGFEFF